jgi:hypothetical protein
MGTRVFDLNCGWTMYREPYNGAFRYKCGLYQQSHGQQCRHNHVDGLLATRFTLSCIRQKLLRLLPQVEQRLRDFAAASEATPLQETEGDGLKIELTNLQLEIKTVSSNLAIAKSDAQFQAVSAHFDQLRGREAALQIKLAEASARQTAGKAHFDVKTIVGGFEKLLDKASDETNLKLAGEAIQMANAKLFLKFEQAAVKKRTLNRISSGVATFGDSAPPIELFKGPTARDPVKMSAGTRLAKVNHFDHAVEKTDSLIVSDREEKSLGNVSRADWIRTSDLLTPSQTRYQTALRPENR